MHTIILTGVLDYRPQLAICSTGAELRAALADWFDEIVPDADFQTSAPHALEDAISEAMAPSDWTALECFPLIDSGFAFTGESVGIGLALECYAEDEGERGGPRQGAVESG